MFVSDVDLALVRHFFFLCTMRRGCFANISCRPVSQSGGQTGGGRRGNQRPPAAIRLYFKRDRGKTKKEVKNRLIFQFYLSVNKNLSNIPDYVYVSYDMFVGVKSLVVIYWTILKIFKELCEK